MQRELEVVASRLRKLAISEGRDEYQMLVTNADRYDNKIEIFELLGRKCNALSEVMPLLFTFCSKLSIDDEHLLGKIIDFMRGCKDINSREECEWIIKILFLIVEMSKEKRKGSGIRLKLTECIKIYGEKTGIVSHLIDLMSSKSGGDTIWPILESTPSICGEFVRACMNQTSQTVQKNLSVLLPQLSERHAELFCDYEKFDEFCDSEYFFMRSCFLEVYMNLVGYFKTNRDVEKMNDIIDLIVERMSDTYFLVRQKALHILGALFERNSISIGKRAHVIDGVCSRILDKTVAVRKRAIGLCCSVLANHPFVSEQTLEKRAVKDIKDECERRYYEDLNDFHDSMKKAQKSIMELLSGDVRTEAGDCIEFMKLALHYGIEGSDKAFSQIFRLVWTREVDLLAQSFRDLLIQKKQNGMHAFVFLKRFVRQCGDYSFERILKELYRRGYLEKSFTNELRSVFMQGSYLFESSYLLLHTSKPISVDSLREMLICTTNMLFSSKGEDELATMLSVYKNVIRIRTRQKVDPADEIITLMIKNLTKMVFFDHQVVEMTVDAIYGLSAQPEISSVALIKGICSASKGGMKIVCAVGCVAIRHMQYLEELEKLVKAKRISVNVDRSVLTPEITERRKSINASRLSISMMANDEGKVDGIPRDIEIEINSNISPKLMDRSEEEISDFFFYVKEKEMLYGNNSVICMFKKMIEEMCVSECDDAKVVAYTALYKLMCVSFEYFSSHYQAFIASMKHLDARIRANAIVAMSDFLQNYNTAVEGDCGLLIDALGDTDIDVRKNAFLVIHTLLTKNFIKIKGYGSRLVALLGDDDLSMRRMAENLLIQISKNETTIAALFYEAVTAQDAMLMQHIEFLTELIGEKVKENLFAKISRSKVHPDLLKRIHDAFCLNSKLTEDLPLNQ
ncbi:chromosome condensation complex Condensin [Ordospora colligata]|uniref:Chromosome condensation complex Condensin n=1 Tax=Ordospora colligata OC4 TaxID=1354746 RepID=A0A0B2UMM0_9MICR|nr:chromosome condensation complex Condensin [Ordospora colligata OC4]KHN70282.1 chromosome condensation complex Condensin [Ordospora colligata OC4]TBU16826.1 chromosome condensation complex Condensin [Ordospora colligata]TBU16934.1 chromosome condensation complex Condensin [Ordospora colligata]TBU19375.1 chromosome condensation complex Condensin [Ordospora colligata]